MTHQATINTEDIPLFGFKEDIAPNGKLLASYYLWSNMMNESLLRKHNLIQPNGDLFPHNSFVLINFVLEKLGYPKRMLELAEEINGGPFVWILTLGRSASPQYPFNIGSQFELKHSLGQSYNEDALLLTDNLCLFNFDVTITNFYHEIMKNSDNNMMEELFVKFFKPVNLPLVMIREYRDEIVRAK